MNTDIPDIITPREERDACAIIAFVDKRGHNTHANIAQTIDALRKMGHRSGDIHGEGDGCGIAIDIPRELWARRLAGAGLSPHLAESGGFFVGHFLLPASALAQKEAILASGRELLAASGAEIFLELTDGIRTDELGPRARRDAPFFWQICGMVPEASRNASRRTLFKLQLELEGLLPVFHIASLSLDSVVYKVQGLPEQLPRVFPELRDQDTGSVITLGHGRYSTNTLPTVERSQPFSLVCHNGEINTIDHLRRTGRSLGIEPVPGGSDSQDLNRVIEGLLNLYDLELPEAMEMVFPTIHSEVVNYPPHLQELYAFYRWFFPCSAQGPAAVLARGGDLCMGSVDALGLRPLWFGESDYAYFLSSEKGVVDLERNMSDPRPLGPGEKIAVYGSRGRKAEILEYGAVQDRLVRLLTNRPRARKYLSSLYTGVPAARKNSGRNRRAPGEYFPAVADRTGKSHGSNLLAAFGWRRYDLDIRKRVAHSGREVIGSMGHTGPLASFIPDSLPNIADFCKENVAVVTNPAIDREREAEHFSTRLVLGSRPDIRGEKHTPPLSLSLNSPLLLSSQALAGLVELRACRTICRRYSTMLFEDVLDFFTGRQRDPGRIHILDATFTPDQGLATRLSELTDEAGRAVARGAVLLVLDDAASFEEGRVFVDPALAVSALQQWLTASGRKREAGLVVRSAAIRNLHDIMLLLGLGADALCPYRLWRVSAGFADDRHRPAEVIDNTFSVLQKGIEKVISTMGIHELCGYGRIFSGIGFRADLAELLNIPAFCLSAHRGLDLAGLEGMGRERLRRAMSTGETAVYKEPARNPRVGRVLRNVATGKSGYLEMAGELEKIAEELPTGIRHLLRLKKAPPSGQPPMNRVDISIGRHDMPVLIAAMSFGSQGEASFRTYAEAARKANIICINGEGGEIPDMLGRYRRNRGQQIASGRFGVFMGFLNSADYLEIKIGQGAKPGEGGHLPGNKVSAMVARARRCKAGITLISPSNHHDIYSIEDLAQIITELKTANPRAQVSVKIPVSSGIGTIAVGIAKAGADVLNISGFEGGTGAAREHAKRYVGLPAEIGVSEAHRALVESGLRDGIELWTDGGMRSGEDVLKMILLGANRVGIGTAVLMGIGCISCRRCHLDRCPRGISTRLQTKSEAEEKGIKGFTPRVLEVEAENLARLLAALGDELRLKTAELGETRLQDLVGRTDLLSQYRMQEQLDAAEILRKPVPPAGPEQSARPRLVRKPLDYLTRLISDLAMERFEQGETVVRFAEEGVRSTDRAVGTYLAGAIERRYGEADSRKKAMLLLGSSVPGNGLCAFISEGIEAVVEGGSQDGAVKGTIGGVLGVFKGQNLLGRRIDGSTGKSFAYGAIGGLLMVQNMADSRACIRMSGADVVFGGRITGPVRDDLGNLACRAHLKGFAFEYMTGGRVVVLGDPGPWICSGMTGGVIYQCLYPELGFDRQAVARRLAAGASVSLRAVSKKGLTDIRALLGRYIEELERGLQADEARAAAAILAEADRRFLMIQPRGLRPPSSE